VYVNVCVCVCVNVRVSACVWGEGYACVCVNVYVSFNHVSFIIFIFYSVNLSLVITRLYTCLLPSMIFVILYISQYSYLTISSSHFAGIGESKSGLPLGRLTLRFGKLTFPSTDFRALDNTPLARLRVTLRGTYVQQHVQCSIGHTV
jgi:hypothetical protein